MPCLYWTLTIVTSSPITDTSGRLEKQGNFFFEMRSRVHLIFVTQKKVKILEFLHVFLWISLVETEKIQIFEHWRQDKTLISGHIILEEWLFAQKENSCQKLVNKWNFNHFCLCLESQSTDKSSYHLKITESVLSQSSSGYHLSNLFKTFYLSLW